MKSNPRWIGLLCAGLSFLGTASAQTISRTLSAGWQFHSLRTPQPSQQVDWRAAVVPGVVQQDLLRYGLIRDPSYGLNEKTYQWAGLSDWEYRNTFSLTPAERACRHIDLVFEGLDTFATVYLNGEPVLQADNMFRQWRLPLAHKLRPGGNELRIVFHSPVTSLLDKVKALPFHLPTVNQIQEICEEGIATDPYTRKAPYQYGWDFNPRLVTEGIWQPVRLEAWNKLRLDDLHIHQRHIAKDGAYFDTGLSIDADSAATALVEITYQAPAAAAFSPLTRLSVALHPGMNDISLPGSIRSPQLWWPNDYGPQAMYRFKAIVQLQGETVRAEKSVGFRSVELRREKDQWGKSFGFIINGVPIFAKGVSVVPIDVFPNRITRERLLPMLTAARDAHMNMLRVWGGGIYEPDAFYEICDRLGLMIWHDFMFGGEMPAYDADFLDNVRHEAIDQVRRLRDHPSIVLWCGNNEIETAWNSWKERIQFKNALPPDSRDAVWGGYLRLSNTILGGVVAAYSPGTPYWPSSPSADYDMPPSNNSDGDMHYWKVWYNNLPSEKYTELLPRFISEFGFESFPAMATLRSFAPPDQLHLESPVMSAHQKSMGAHGNQIIAAAVQRDYGKPVDFPALVYLSQVEQADAMKVGVEDFRRLRPRTMGALYWELQDGWPDIYSASIDYYGRWKALQWYARRFYSPLLISPCTDHGQVNVFAISDRRQAVSGIVRLRLLDFLGRVLEQKEQSVNVPPLSSTLVLSLEERQLLNGQDPKRVFIHVEWLQGEKLLSSNNLFFAPAADLLLPKAVVHGTITPGGKLQVSSDVLARDVCIELQDPDARPDDNFFDLLPGQPVSVAVHGKAPLRSLQPHVISMTDALARLSE